MSLMFTSKEAKEATIEQLSQSVLECADGSRIGDSIAMVAAKELARRICPDLALVEPAPQNPVFMDGGGGRAPASAAERRINEAAYEILSAPFRRASDGRG